ncbi:MAG TPA: hypothetical protein DIU18_05545, partial [Gemmatimonadetes bacterium]|nr:hypothetical protein [Gemmatimonadota bacterium]
AGAGKEQLVNSVARFSSLAESGMGCSRSTSVSEVERVRHPVLLLADGLQILRVGTTAVSRIGDVSFHPGGVLGRKFILRVED